MSRDEDNELARYITDSAIHSCHKVFGLILDLDDHPHIAEAVARVEARPKIEKEDSATSARLREAGWGRKSVCCGHGDFRDLWRMAPYDLTLEEALEAQDKIDADRGDTRREGALEALRELLKEVQSFNSQLTKAGKDFEDGQLSLRYWAEVRIEARIEALEKEESDGDES